MALCVPRSLFLVLLALACNRPRTPGVWDFEGDRQGAVPSGFDFVRGGEGRPGRWTVKRLQEGGVARTVLTQSELEPSKKRYLIALAQAAPIADVTATARCKLVAGGLDRGCGVVVRYRDERNYYLARIDSLDGDLRMYSMRDGSRAAFATYTGRISDGEWHELRVDAIADRFVVWLDGRAVIDAHDAGWRGPGRVGVWTKSDAITYFDELRARPAGK